MSEDFFEEDEPVENVKAAWDRGVKGVTARPRNKLHLQPWEREDRRRKIAELIDGGMNQRQVSEQLGLAQSAVSRWWRITKRMRENGPSSWGSAEFIVYSVLHKHRVGAAVDALESEITSALREAGLLNECTCNEGGSAGCPVHDKEEDRADRVTAWMHDK
jgi:transposase-like protein